jgi:nitrite reductase/ring-hydroxylating ferredoxin subunit
MTDIVAADEVPEDSTYLFRVREVDGDEEREAILVRLDGEVAGWLNYCQHMTRIKLDKGSGAAIRDGEIICRNHGAMFETDTGECTFGPCEGAFLDDVEVTVEDGTVVLVDDVYEYVGEGPVPDEHPADLSSTSNIEF